jgi:hypothetical protein
MSDTLLSLMLAAGVATFVYTKMGPRLGYGNTKSVWTVVGVCFGLVFLFSLTLLKYVLHI